MFDPKREEKALEKWALGEMRRVGERAFEFAKFFFAISAGSFGILPFFGENFSPANLLQDTGLLLIGVSAFLAIRMAEPPHFDITDKTVLSEEHAKFSKRIR